MTLLHLPKIDFSEEKCHENAYKSIFKPLDFKFSGRGRHAPDPLAARAFGARNFPRLVLKSGYGPVLRVIFLPATTKVKCCDSNQFVKD